MHPHAFPETVYVLLAPIPVQDTQDLVDEATNELVGSGHSQIYFSELKTKFLLHLQDVALLTAPLLFLFFRVMQAKHLSLIKIVPVAHRQMLEAAT